MEDNQYHNRHSIRLANFDYSASGIMYFITIVIDYHKCFLGNVFNGGIRLSEAGEMVKQEYLNLSKRFPSFCFRDYVIMPNHIHFIVTKEGTDEIPLYKVMETFKSITTNKYCIGVKERTWQPYECHFWQRNYYEHVIRNERSFNLIRNYIFQNPSRWINDKLNPNCDPSDLDDINAAIKNLE